VLIVGIDGAAVETDLIGGRLSCPDCASGLRPWGHSVEREVRLLDLVERRRFRRSICRTCAVTHVLVPEDTLCRRRDGTEVIGAALAAKARGEGHRSIARNLERAPSTVRGWLRRFGARASELREHFTRWAQALDPGHDRLFGGATALCDAVDAVGVLGMVAVRRFGPRPPWSLASVVTGGGLLCNTSALWAQPV
jgi:transposase-like protein